MRMTHDETVDFGGSVFSVVVNLRGRDVPTPATSTAV